MPLDQYVDQPVSQLRGMRGCDSLCIGHWSTAADSLLGLPLASLWPQAAIMRRVPADEAANFPVPIYAEFQAVLDCAAGSDAGLSSPASPVSVEQVERFAFYERARKCFAVVQTGERRQYGNIIIKKGVLRADE